MKKILSLILSLAVILAGLSGFKPQEVKAQELDYACMGEALADYMNTVIKETEGVSDVKLLTPAFNMTSYTFNPIVDAMANAPTPARFGAVDGVAGNAYNLDGRRITDWVTDAMKNPHLRGLPVMVTEMGMIEREPDRGAVPYATAVQNLKEEIVRIRANRSGITYLGGLIFNPFGTNPGFEYDHRDESGATITNATWRDICGGSCTKIGANTASYFSHADAYDRADELNMNFVLEIANNDAENVANGINQMDRGITPVVRIGVGTSSDGFDDPQTYSDFIKSVASQTDREIYFIAGPNEPDAEHWLFSDCDLPDSIEPDRPLDQGFYVGQYSCQVPATPEFHPLRPYPANACDPLIPQSVPPATSEFPPDYERFITYSCGNSLIPQGTEGFDPYGNNAGLYGNLRVDDTLGNQYAHTVCDNPDGSGQVTCYRSSSFDVTLDLKDANVGILGNTQDPGLTNEQKINEYLAYYFAGVPQVGDHKTPTVDELINFSGPLRKLLPWDLQNISARSTIALAGNQTTDIHDYIVGCRKDVSLEYINDIALADLQLRNLSPFELVKIGRLTIIIANTVGLQKIQVVGYTLTSRLAYAQFNEESIKLELIQMGLEALANNEEFVTLVLELGQNTIREIGNVYQAINLDLVEDCSESRADARLSNYVSSNNLPPERAEDEELKDYIQRLYDWRGYSFIAGVPLDINFFSQTIWSLLFQNIPLAGVEDIAGEFIATIIEGGNLQDPDVSTPQQAGDITTAPAKLVITRSTPASGSSGNIITPPNTYTPPILQGPPDRLDCSATGTLKIMPLGDSNTKGYLDNYPGYRQYLWDMLQTDYKIDFVGTSTEVDGTPAVDDDHEGHGNQNTTYFLENIDSWLNNLGSTNSPDIVLLMAGTVNLTGHPEARTAAESIVINRENIGKILDKLETRGVKVILAKIPKRAGYLDDVTEYNKQLEQFYGSRVTMVDMEKIPLALFPDGVHPYKEGYRIMAEEWKAGIDSLCGQ